MNYKVTATPNGKGKVKITVTCPDGTSYVHTEKAKEGRFTHYAVVEHDHGKVTRNQFNDIHFEGMPEANERFNNEREEWSASRP